MSPRYVTPLREGGSLPAIPKPFAKASKLTRHAKDLAVIARYNNVPRRTTSATVK